MYDDNLILAFTFYFFYKLISEIISLYNYIIIETFSSFGVYLYFISNSSHAGNNDISIVYQRHDTISCVLKFEID